MSSSSSDSFHETFIHHPKTIRLPSGFNLTKNGLLKILHNHEFLINVLYSGFDIKKEDDSTFNVEDTHMVTLIDTDNGVTVFEGSSGSLKLIHWMVTNNESKELGYTWRKHMRCGAL